MESIKSYVTFRKVSYFVYTTYKLISKYKIVKESPKIFKQYEHVCGSTLKVELEIHNAVERSDLD